MRERVQKLLAREGYGSRREIERWIRAGRLAINGQIAALGALVGPDDRVALDGRPLHVHRPESGAVRSVMYHRPAGESLEHDADTPSPLFAVLPKRGGRRWIVVSLMHPSDSGLELLTSDGALASALMRRAGTLGARFAVRVRGEASPEQLQTIGLGRLDDGSELGEVAIEPSGGSGANRWYEITLKSTRATAVRRLLTLAGLEVSRLMRIGYGPLALDPGLARGRHRELEPAERDALYAAAGLEPPSQSQASDSRPRRTSTRTALDSRRRRRDH